MDDFFRSLEHLAVARAVRDSLWLTASLSAAHLLGVTLVGGGALLSGLRAAGVFWRDEPLDSIVRPAVRAIACGVLLAIATGVFLAAPRALSASRNGFFQWKMASLFVALAVQSYLLTRTLPGRGHVSAAVTLVGAAACLSVIVAACAFILLE